MTYIAVSNGEVDNHDRPAEKEKYHHQGEQEAGAHGEVNLQQRTQRNVF